MICTEFKIYRKFPYKFLWLFTCTAGTMQNYETFAERKEISVLVTATLEQKNAIKQ